MLGISVLIISFGMPIYSNWQSGMNLDVSKIDTRQTILLARTKAIAGVNNSSHGVYFNTGLPEPEIILYQGSDYASRNTDYDETISMPISFDLTVSAAITDLNFSIYEGYPNASGTIIALDNNRNESWQLNINPIGLIY